MFDTLHRVLRETEERIQRLCREVLAAKTETDAERIIPELRAALHEHVQLAKDSLASQATAIAVLDAAAEKDSQALWETHNRLLPWERRAE